MLHRLFLLIFFGWCSLIFAFAQAPEEEKLRAVEKDVSPALALYKKQDYAETLLILESHLPLLLETLKDPASLKSLLTIMITCYEETGRAEKAQSLHEALSKVEIESSETFSSLDQKVNELYQLGRYEEAIVWAEKALVASEKEFGTDHPAYASTLRHLANMHESLGHYAQAESYFSQVANIVKKLFGESHPGYASPLNNLAFVNKSLGRYTKAEAFYRQSLKIKKQHLGENHLDYAKSLGNLAILYEAMGRYEEAIALTQQTIKIRKEQLGENHPDYATSQNSLAVLYYKTDRYQEAEQLFHNVMQTFAQELGTPPPYFATLLNNLAHLYNSTGRYAEAEPLYRQALTIHREQLGEDHPGYATSLLGFAAFLRDMGRYQEAEPLFQQVIKIRRQRLGEDHPDYATSLDNLAMLYIIINRYEEAIALTQQTIRIRKEQLGENHPNYATSLTTLSALYIAQGDLQKAEPLQLNATKIYKQQLGEYNFLYANSLRILGYLYKRMNRAQDAESHYLQALAIYKHQFGEDHIKSITALDGLTDLYVLTANYNKAKPLLLKANQILQNNLYQTFSGLSEKEKKQYLHTIESNFEAYQAISFKMKGFDPSITTLSYNNTLINKGLLLRSSQDMREAIRLNTDSSLLATYDDWINLKHQLSQLYTLPITQRYADTDSLEVLANTLEKKLNRGASAFQTQSQALKVKWEDVQHSLGASEAAVEFIHFRHRNDTTWSDTTYYAALILRPQDAYPQMIKLCTGAQLDSLLADSISTDPVWTFYTSRGADVANKELEKGEALYRLIWSPLNSLFSNIETIYFSPSGYLHQVAFAALPYQKDSLLMDRYSLHQLSSTRILALEETESSASPRSATLFGGIRYDTDTTEILTMVNNRGLRSTISAYLLKEDMGYNTLDYLPGTASEVSFIADQLENQGIPKELYTGSEAIEERFKQIGRVGPSPAILHVATHGFFFPVVKDTLRRNELLASLNEQQQVYRLTNDPLRRAGLLMAGANHAWLGEKIPKGLDDGILTAYEVSQMNLSNTELVVLSACETGLGQIQGSEGVYGLQRGFKMAGAKNLIMSLWQVPDQETQEMMQLFYRLYLQEKLSIREAFRKAQQQMREKYDPYFWAAFTLVE